MDQLTFGLLSYVLSGARLHIRRRQDATMCDTLFRGTIEDLHTPPNRDLHNRLDMMKVAFIDAEGGELLIGVDEE